MTKTFLQSRNDDFLYEAIRTLRFTITTASVQELNYTNSAWCLHYNDGKEVRTAGSELADESEALRFLHQAIKAYEQKALLYISYIHWDLRTHTLWTKEAKTIATL